METRKLQEVGGGTYTVSVPKEWARAHHLEAGSTLHLYTHRDGSLVVRTSRKDGGDLAATRIVVEGESPAAAGRTLAAAHAVGFDAVTLVAPGSFTEEQLGAVRSAVEDLVGTEIVEEAGDEITVRNLLDASDVSVRQSLIQLQFVALSVHREAAAALVDADGDAVDRLRRRGDEASRLRGMISRHFNRSLTSFEEVDRLGISRPSLFDYHAAAARLEAVTARAVDVARAAERLPDPPPDGMGEELRDAAEAAGRAVEEAVTAVVADAGIGEAHAALETRDEALDGIGAIDRRLAGGAPLGGRSPAASAYALGRALGGLARTAEHGGAIAEVAIRAAVRADP